MDHDTMQLYVIALLFVAAVAGTIFSALPGDFSLSSGNLAGAATTSSVDQAVADQRATDELVYVLNQNDEREKPLLIVTQYEYDALPEDMREEFDIYITSN